MVIIQCLVYAASHTLGAYQGEATSMDKTLAISHGADQAGDELAALGGEGAGVAMAAPADNADGLRLPAAAADVPTALNIQASSAIFACTISHIHVNPAVAFMKITKYVCPPTVVLIRPVESLKLLEEKELGWPWQLLQTMLTDSDCLLPQLMSLPPSTSRQVLQYLHAVWQHHQRHTCQPSSGIYENYKIRMPLYRGADQAGEELAALGGAGPMAAPADYADGLNTCAVVPDVPGGGGGPDGGSRSGRGRGRGRGLGRGKRSMDGNEVTSGPVKRGKQAPPPGSAAPGELGCLLRGHVCNEANIVYIPPCMTPPPPPPPSRPSC